MHNRGKNMKKVRVGVVGTGSLGQHHVRYYSQMEGVTLAGISDVNEKRLEKFTEQYSVPGFSDYRQLIGRVDAVSIVSPTPLHHEISREFINNKVDCLIEKPITTNTEQAEDLITLARNKNVIIQVGHIERFNPAVLEAQKYINSPRFIEAYRLSPYDPRVSTVGVVLDVMVHDLDIVTFLVNSKITDIEVFGAKVFSKHEDMVKCRLYFENGCVADLIASRVSTGKYRRIRIFQENTYISINYMGQGLKIIKKKKDAVDMNGIEVLRPRLAKVEQLKIELEHFIECVRSDRKPFVTGEHGRDAVNLAMEILKKMEMLL